METVKSPAEQRVVLHNVSWETYERLLEERGERRVPRFTYDRGELEVISPSPEHESIGYYVGLLVAVLAEETDVNAYGVGSATFKRANLERGFEPDACFYIENEKLVRGKPRIDLDVDPSPDLVVEVDITSPSLSKFSIYARSGVAEIWRYDGERFGIFKLENAEYLDTDKSIVLPPLTSDALRRFVEASKSIGLTDWLKAVREWTREHIRQTD